MPLFDRRTPELIQSVRSSSVIPSGRERMYSLFHKANQGSAEDLENWPHSLEFILTQPTESKPQMSPKQFLFWCIVILFVISGLVFTIMGFGDTYDMHEGQAGVYKVDRIRSIHPAQWMLKGDFSFYKIKFHPPFLTEEGRKYTYPPVSAFVITPLVYAANRSGMSEKDLFYISILPFIVLSGLGVLLIGIVFEKYSKEEITIDGILLAAIFLFSGMLYYSAVKAGKFEGVVAFFALCGILFQPRRVILSGIFFGLAVGTKQIAILFIIPAFFVFMGEKNYRDLIVWTLSLGLTVLLMLLPFVLGSGLGDVYFALMKNFDVHRIQSHTTIGYIYAAIRLVAEDKSGTIENFLQHHANKFILFVCVAASYWLVRKKEITRSKPEQYFALIVLNSFFYIIAGKWYTSAIYEVAPTYFFVLWAIVSGQTLFAAIILLLQSFICCSWPVALYKDQLLLLMYYILTVYVFRASFVSGKRESPA